MKGKIPFVVCCGVGGRALGSHTVCSKPSGGRLISWNSYQLLESINYQTTMLFHGIGSCAKIAYICIYTKLHRATATTPFGNNDRYYAFNVGSKFLQRRRLVGINKWSDVATKQRKNRLHRLLILESAWFCMDFVNQDPHAKYDIKWSARCASRNRLI